MLNIKRVNIKFLLAICCLFLASCSMFKSSDNKQLCPCKLLKDNNVTKVIVVEPYDVSYAKVTMMQKIYNEYDKPYWHKVAIFDGRVGRNGTIDSNLKKEGDGMTPKGIYNLKDAFGINDIKLNIPYRVLDGTEYWVDDVNAKSYNTMQFVKGGETPSFNSAEHLIDVKTEYQYAMVIDYNDPPVKGKGSAIFLHVENNKATSGCVAVSKENMIKILNWVDEGKTKIIIK